MKTLRVLPADVFDALELSALVHGGIGAGDWFDSAKMPLCATAHRWFLDGEDYVLTSRGEVAEAFRKADIYSTTNDPVVRAINRRHGAPRNARVPFDEWCAEMNVIRGE